MLTKCWKMSSLLKYLPNISLNVFSYELLFGCNLSLNVFWISLIVLSINSLTIQYFSSWRKIISNLHGKLSTHTKYFFLHIWSTIRQDLLTKFSRTSQTNSHSRIIMYFGPSHSDLYLVFCFEPNAPYHVWCPSSLGGAPHSVSFYLGQNPGDIWVVEERDGR